MTGFRIASTAVFLCSLALAGAVTVLSGLSAVYLWNPQCVERAHLQGSRMGVDDFVGLPLMVWLVVLMVRKIGGDPKVGPVTKGDFIIFEFRALRLTDGMVAVYSVLFGMVVVIGLMALVALKRYLAISEFCRAIWN